MIEMFKLSHGYYDVAAIHDFIEFGPNDTSEPRLRRHKYHVKKERFRKDVRKFAFKFEDNYVSRNMWNILTKGSRLRPQL